MKRAMQAVLLITAVMSGAITPALGRDPAEVELVRIRRADHQVKIELTLSAGVIPVVTRTTAPDRLVVELPQTSTVAGQHSMTVHYGSVERVRIGLHQATPPVARMVVDLNSAGPYELNVQGSTIALTVLPVVRSETDAGSSAPRSWLKKSVGQKIRKVTPTLISKSDAPISPQTERAAMPFVVTPAAARAPRISFRVKYIAEGVAYLGGGGNSGLTAGMKLTVWDGEPRSDDSANQFEVAELRVTSVAEASALTEVRTFTRAVRPGDWAYLTVEDSVRLERESIQNTGKLRASSLRAGQPDGLTPETQPDSGAEENRMRGRIALDYSGIRSHGSTPGSSSQVGLAFRSDMTNIAGTHWNLQGYWRGRLTQNSEPQEQTMQDYLDRTYTLQLYYNNPQSNWLAGVGRLYLPWAVSLDTIDGGYVGHRLARGVIAGGFAGSTPDPASWHYNRDQQIAGSFINFGGGSYDRLHYSSTSGFALSMLRWSLDRPFGFFENELSYGKYFSVYHSLIVDSPQGLTTGGIKPGAGISRSYLTFHIQPHPRISIDVYHNYFRDTPTAATQLVGTGLVDSLLYQGLNLGLRIEPVRHITLYSTVGQSDKTGDVRRSLNQMYGVTWSDIAHTGFRADLRYSKFDSSFARGDYRLFSLSHQLGDQMLWNAQFGTQSLNSPFTANHGSFFFDTSIDTNLGKRTFLQSGYTIERGLALTYDQWYISLGYRFDVREKVNAGPHEFPTQK